MNRISLLAAYLLLTGCGGDDTTAVSSTPVPPSAPVATSISLEWTSHPAFGGPVDDFVRRGSDVFVTEQGNLWRFDTQAAHWDLLEIRGFEFVTTTSGDIYTDTGYRLGVGDHEWEKLAFEGRLWLGADGETLYRRGDENAVLVSADGGSTWRSLPTAPEYYFSLAEFKGDLYAAISGARNSDVRGLWRLTNGAQEWQRVSLDDSFVNELANSRDEALLALSSSKLYWSPDGNEWQQLSSDTPLSQVTAAGTGASGALLLGDWNRLYSFNSGELASLLEIPVNAHIRQAGLVSENTFLLGSDTGLWRVTTDDEAAPEVLGVPGDRAMRIFHLTDAVYASVSNGPGYAHLARLDEVRGAWTQQVLHEFHVNDIAELPGGDKLLATSWAYEGGYGSLFRWLSDGSIDQLLNTRSVISVVVTENGTWLVSTGPSMESDDFLVLRSTDEGESWSEIRRETKGPQTLLTNCGKTYAAGASGLHEYNASSAKWNALAGSQFEFVGAAARGRNMLLYSKNRLWQRQDCADIFDGVSLPQNTVLIDVALDKDGGIWATTKTGGIHLAVGEEGWKWFSDDLPAGELRHISIGNNGTAWVRVRGEGIFSGDRF